MNLNELMGHAPEEKKIDPEVAVMRLLEWAERYAEAREGPRFAVGVFVTPSADCPQGGAGKPFLVIETRIVCSMDHQPQTCQCSRDDIRVLGINGPGDVVPVWAESAQFELLPNYGKRSRRSGGGSTGWTSSSGLR